MRQRLRYKTRLEIARRIFDALRSLYPHRAVVLSDPRDLRSRAVNETETDRRDGPRASAKELN